MDTETEENWSLPVFFPRKTGKCEICGEMHLVEKCPLVDGFKDYVPDSPTLSYARLTLPEGLEVRNLSDGAKTVVATKSFSKGLKFGPFIAKSSTLIDVRIEFPLKVFLSEDENESVYLETYEEIFCNWMCLVLPASRAEEQNLICFQIKTNIYFCSLRNIDEGEELRVWYAPYYANKMGVQSLPKPTDLIHSSDEEFKEIFESLQSGAEMQDHQYLPKSKKRRRLPKKLVLGENYYRQVPPSDTLPGELLGANRREDWECSACGQVEHNVAAYARHLMTHYHHSSRPSYRCPYCDRNFRKDGYNRLIHVEVCKRKKLKESTQGESSNQSAQSKMTFVVRTVNPSEAPNSELEKENKNVCELQPDNSLWNKLVILVSMDESDNKNNPILNKPIDVCDKREMLNSETIHSSEVDKPENVILNGKIDDISRDKWNIDRQTERLDGSNTGNLKAVCSNADGKNENNKSTEQSKTSENNLDRNHLMKSHMNPPILDLSDDIDFNLTKSFDEMINDDCNLDKSIAFSKNRSLDLFGAVETNILSSDVPNLNSSSIESSSFYSLEKNEFLPADFATCNDVTDEERNRIVENLLSETDDKFFPSDYEMTDACTSENPESQAKDGQQGKEKEVNDGKKRQSKTAGDFICAICNKSFTKSLYLYRHLRKHTGEHRCNTCFTVFSRKENLQNHRMICPNEANTKQTIRRVRVSCKFCRLQFYTLADFQEHMEGHYCSGNTWKCRCNAISDSQDLFLKHKCAFSEKSSSKSCTKCGKKFNSLEEFVDHKKHPVKNIIKKRNEKHLCEFCGVMSLTVTGARLHRASVHGEKTHQCTECDKRFCTKNKLDDHMQTHTKQEELFWECSICSKRFVSEKVCVQHQKSMHSEPAFSCPYCDKLFRQKCNLKKHLKVHENTLDCSLCSMEFRTPQQLQLHSKVQHSVFNCDLCDASFKVKWRLKTHMRKHCEFYKCKYCQMQIKYKAGLKKHLSRAHKDKMEEWDNPEALRDMWLGGTEKATDELSANPSINDILQTAAVDVMEEENLNINDNVEGSNNGDIHCATMEQLTHTDFVTTIVEGNMTDGSNPAELTFDLSCLQDSDNVSQLVSVDGDVVTVPLSLISNLPSSSPLTAPDVSRLVSVDGDVISVPLNLISNISSPPPATTTDDQSSVVISEEGIVSCPVLLPEGYLLTLDNNLVAKPEEGSTLVDVSDYQALAGVATTSAYVLTDESVIESDVLQNNVLFYIGDTSLPDSIE